MNLSKKEAFIIGVYLTKRQMGFQLLNAQNGALEVYKQHPIRTICENTLIDIYDLLANLKLGIKELMDEMAFSIKGTDSIKAILIASNNPQAYPINNQGQFLTKEISALEESPRANNIGESKYQTTIESNCYSKINLAQWCKIKLSENADEELDLSHTNSTNNSLSNSWKKELKLMGDVKVLETVDTNELNTFFTAQSEVLIHPIDELIADSPFSSAIEKISHLSSDLHSLQIKVSGSPSGLIKMSLDDQDSKLNQQQLYFDLFKNRDIGSSDELIYDLEQFAFSLKRRIEEEKLPTNSILLISDSAFISTHYAQRLANICELQVNLLKQHEFMSILASFYGAHKMILAKEIFNPQFHELNLEFLPNEEDSLMYKQFHEMSSKVSPL